ncbi:hypothetical protein ACG83_21935 [Frankia sp. R43]|uniref:hypothetical protein n=1 Tax=Frankia sp. R43 TaxID=269536 RepID=UPI0006CA464B|nr:hypothetical protein [Frankia sp. R43]KPM53384.1 hypothetical protein ACG83_21935 [Frankia sp. R43]
MTTTGPTTIDALTDLLRRLYRPGIRYAATLLHSPHAEDTIRLVTGRAPGPADDDRTRLDHLTQAHTIICAAVAALGEPERTIARHLLDLHGDSTRVRGGIETRREHAARLYSTNPATPITGPSFQRRHEPAITLLLAAEIIRRVPSPMPRPHPRATPNADVLGTAHSATPAPAAPPPPASAYQPKPRPA